MAFRNLEGSDYSEKYHEETIVNDITIRVS